MAAASAAIATGKRADQLTHVERNSLLHQLHRDNAWLLECVRDSNAALEQLHDKLEAEQKVRWLPARHTGASGLLFIPRAGLYSRPEHAGCYCIAATWSPQQHKQQQSPSTVTAGLHHVLVFTRLCPHVDCQCTRFHWPLKSLLAIALPTFEGWKAGGSGIAPYHHGVWHALLHTKLTCTQHSKFVHGRWQ